TGEPAFVEFSDLMHMQVGGVPGYGKSVFLQSLIAQCLDLGDELSKVYVIDLKGTDFARFEGNRVEVVFEFDRVIGLVEELVKLMHQRLTEMRAKGLVKWPKGRLVVVVDEFGQLMYWGVDPKGAKSADIKAAEAIQARMISNLCRLGMLGRAAGVTLVCATQKLTIDAIPSALRANLDWAVFFRTSRQMASSVFGADAGLQFDPPRLSRGQAVAFIDGETRYFQSFMPRPETKNAA
ncbi:MAG TPA: FtsK/SpoIIIE domain-containing protein, partial [Xanthobacteraceae bacterium]|nr:FtsK/SpoIIIE domain-containing protein [Xanthobacteraceae bacterium]